MLDNLISHLKRAGYKKAQRMPSSKKRKPDEQILRECRQAARTAELAIFVFFEGEDDPNQSAIIELTERIDKLQDAAGRLPGPHNTLVVFQKGTKPKALLRGLLEPRGISSTESWRDQMDVNELVQGWLLTLCLDEERA